jgi:hypothetical protein
MKYTSQLGSVPMIYVLGIINILSVIQKLTSKINRQIDTHTAWQLHKPVSFFKIRNIC